MYNADAKLLKGKLRKFIFFILLYKEYDHMKISPLNIQRFLLLLYISVIM